MSRNYCRQVREKAIKRKSKIASSILNWSSTYLNTHKGQLNKGKVHCSCPICACKSTRFYNKSINGIAGYPKQERARFQAMDSEIKEFGYQFAYSA